MSVILASDAKFVVVENACEGDRMERLIVITSAEVAEVSESALSMVLPDDTRIEFYPGVPRESAAFGAWLEQWHREHNPDMIQFVLTESGAEQCKPE